MSTANTRQTKRWLKQPHRRKAGVSARNRQRVGRHSRRGVARWARTLVGR